MSKAGSRLRTRITLILSLLISLAFCGCRSIDSGISQEAYIIDYSDAAAWAYLPERPDELPVDVFFVYPTVYRGKGLQDITDELQRQSVLTPIHTQASVFSDSANLYVPMYRQVGMAEAYSPDGSFDPDLSVGEEDVYQAFSYYLEHFNGGRPFIIAGHSQGSNTLINLLRRIWGSIGCEDHLVAAYLIGYSITEGDLQENPAMRMSAGPADTGCFISWNSLLDGRQDSSDMIREGAFVTNPLDWVTYSGEGPFIPASEHLGAVFIAANGSGSAYYPHFTSAQAKDGGLVCEPSDTSVLSAYPKEGIFHRDDYALFYENLRENVKLRIGEYQDTIDDKGPVEQYE